MNYEANTIEWRVGDIVIHDADAKEPKMLMEITGFTGDGLYESQYCDNRHEGKIYTNNMASLHDPNRFGIRPAWAKQGRDKLSRVQQEWERMRIFNYHRKPGATVTVRTTSADGGFETTTTGPAYMGASGNALIHLKHGGAWWLRFVEVVEAESEGGQ